MHNGQYKKYFMTSQAHKQALSLSTMLFLCFLSKSFKLFHTLENLYTSKEKNDLPHTNNLKSNHERIDITWADLALNTDEYSPITNLWRYYKITSKFM